MFLREKSTNIIESFELRDTGETKNKKVPESFKKIKCLKKIL